MLTDPYRPYGMSFDVYGGPVYGGTAKWDHAGKVTAVGFEYVWYDDDIPAGATPNAPWNWIDSGLNAQFGYTEHYEHTQSGLTFAPFRPYNAGLGRWLSRDPIEERGGLNLYQYVANRPVNEVDLLGLEVFGMFDRKAGTITLTDQQTKERIGPFSAFCGRRYDKNNKLVSTGTGDTPPGTYSITDDPKGKVTEEAGQTYKWYGLLKGQWGFDKPDRNWDWETHSWKEGIRFHVGRYSTGCATLNANDPDTLRNWRQIEEFLNKTSGSNRINGLRKYGTMLVY